MPSGVGVREPGRIDETPARAAESRVVGHIEPRKRREQANVRRGQGLSDKPRSIRQPTLQHVEGLEDRPDCDLVGLLRFGEASAVDRVIEPIVDRCVERIDVPPPGFGQSGFPKQVILETRIFAKDAAIRGATRHGEGHRQRVFKPQDRASEQNTVRPWRSRLRLRPRWRVSAPASRLARQESSGTSVAPGKPGRSRS